jgi:hypothetical protein
MFAVSMVTGFQGPCAQPRIRFRSVRPPVPTRAEPRASLDLSNPQDLAVFTLWGTPVPIAIAVLLAVRERAAGVGGPWELEGAGRNVLFAFPSFGLLLEQPAEPLGMPRWQRALLLANTWAAIGWYLYYKWLIEDELRETTGSGLGGALVVSPFALGLSAGVAGELMHGSLERSLLGELDPFSAAFWAGFAWIYVCQFLLYVRVNRLYTERGDKAPLSVWGLLLPGCALCASRYDARRRACVVTTLAVVLNLSLPLHLRACAGTTL